jgi:hypothetical protein
MPKMWAYYKKGSSHFIEKKPITDFFLGFFKTCKGISGTPNKTFELFLSLPNAELK